MVSEMTVKGGQLYRRGDLIQTVSSKTMLEGFINYLIKIRDENASDEPAHVILVGHNVIRLFSVKLCML